LFWYNIVIGHYHEDYGDDVGGGTGDVMEVFLSY